MNLLDWRLFKSEYGVQDDGGEESAGRHTSLQGGWAVMEPRWRSYVYALSTNRTSSPSTQRSSKQVDKVMNLSFFKWSSKTEEATAHLPVNPG